uniref:Ovule protein n=1 Tax=Heterorhabditis bacteriophora TaxID=37862 RepID=A0A1I7X3S9_HETBA
MSENKWFCQMLCGQESSTIMYQKLRRKRRKKQIETNQLYYVAQYPAAGAVADEVAADEQRVEPAQQKK